MAYLKKIYKSACYACGKTATVELYNRQNAHIGNYCPICGRKALATRQVKERQDQE